MKPRLSTSKKWTGFPEEFQGQIREIFTENFGAFLKGKTLIVEGRIYPKEILLRIGFQEPGQLRQMNFEASMEHSKKKIDAQDRIRNCIDALGSMFEEYISSKGETQFPAEWKPFDFDKQQIHLQYSTVNTELEAQADALLGESEKRLIHEEEENEDALEKASFVKIPKTDGEKP